MAEKKLSEMNVDELKAKEKSLKFAMGMFAGILIVLFAVGLYMAFNGKGSTVFTILPLAFLPIYLGIYAQVKKIKTEIESRNR